MSVDNSHDGASNGSGGQFMHSTQQILDKQAREQAAIAKAADPASLTVEDLTALPGEMAAEIMASGKAAHLGFGGRRTGRRH